MAHSGGHSYETGWQQRGLSRACAPTTMYQPAELKTRKVDVKLAPGLRVGYVMGTGDLVPRGHRGPGRHAAPAHRRGARHGRSFRVERHRDRHPRLLRAPRAGRGTSRAGRRLSARRYADCRNTRAATSPLRCRSPLGRIAGARGGRARAGQAARTRQSAAHLAQRHYHRRLRRLGGGARPLLSDTGTQATPRSPRPPTRARTRNEAACL